MKKLLLALALLQAPTVALAGNVGLGNLDANGNAQVRLFDSSGNPLGTTTNPLSAGGTYNSTPPTLTNGQGASLQMDVNGNLLAHDPTVAALLGASTGTPCASPTTAGCGLNAVLQGMWQANLQEPTVKLDASNIPLAVLPPTSGTATDGTATSAAVIISINPANYQSVVHAFKQIGAGNTVIFEQSPDNGTSDWAPLTCIEVDGGASAPASSYVLSGSGTPMFACPVQLPYQRSRISTYGSGTVEDYAVPTAAPAGVYVQGATLGMGTFAGISNRASLSGGGASSVALDSTAAQYVNLEGQQPTYSTTFTLTPAANPTDIFTISGTGSAAVRLKQVVVQGIATSAGSMTLSFYRRSSADSGGTSTSPHATAMDNNDPTSSASLALYSANPTTLGTAAAPFRSLVVPFCTASAACPPITVDFGTHGEESPHSSSSGQNITLNLGGGTVPTGGSVTVTVLWVQSN